jgi:sulfate transport system ATP-binding protein
MTNDLKLTGTPIRVEHLSKRFGDFEAVRDVTFTAEAGSITALLGPSGSGKSTVLRMIAGLEEPTEGRIWMEGEEHTHKTVQERRVGFVFQHYALFRHMNVAQNVAFGLSVRKTPREERRRRVEELLELVQLSGFRDRYPDQLSGGQRQRVALARALAPRPKVLLLDEPFGALDARVRQELRRWLDDLHRELGVTSLLVTHDQDEALELANRVVVMHEGAVEQVGSPSEIYNEPATPFVAGFVGSANVLNGHVAGGHVEFGGHRVAGADHLEEGEPARAFVRPHDVRLTVVDDGDERLDVSATVERIVTLGWLSRVMLRLPDGQVLTAELPGDELGDVELGSTVGLDLRRAKAFGSEGTAAGEEAPEPVGAPSAP